MDVLKAFAVLRNSISSVRLLFLFGHFLLLDLFVLFDQLGGVESWLGVILCAILVQGFDLDFLYGLSGLGLFDRCLHFLKFRLTEWDPLNLNTLADRLLVFSRSNILLQVMRLGMLILKNLVNLSNFLLK